jgi:AhpD family alkylhydroperoxidase
MSALEAFVRQSGLERSLLHLIKIRASQINGCAFCLDMHTREARADGESEERLYLLSAWREVPDYCQRERAALDWTEAVALVANPGHSCRCFSVMRPAEAPNGRRSYPSACCRNARPSSTRRGEPYACCS